PKVSIVASGYKEYACSVLTKRGFGHAVLANYGRLLRNMQLRLFVSVYLHEHGRQANKGLVHLRDGVSHREGELRRHRFGWFKFCRYRPCAGNYGKGQLVRWTDHRRPRISPTKASDNNYRQRPGRRPPGNFEWRCRRLSWCGIRANSIPKKWASSLCLDSEDARFKL